MALPTTTWIDEMITPVGMAVLVTSDGDYLVTSDGDYILCPYSGSVWADESLPATSWTDE